MWKDLTMRQRAELMDIYLGHGITSLDDMRRDYDLRSSDTANTYREGGSIHISPSKKGTFTAAATKHGMGVQEFASKVLAHPENYSPAMRKKANFARNASKWHGLGGNLYDGTTEPTQQMDTGGTAWGYYTPTGKRRYPTASDGETVDQTVDLSNIANPVVTYYRDTGKTNIENVQNKPVGYVSAFDGSIAPWLEVSKVITAPLNTISPSQQFGAVADAVQGKRNYFDSLLNGNSGFFTNEYEQEHPYITMAGNLAGDIISGAALSKVPEVARATYQGIIQPGMRLFNSPLTSNLTRIGSIQHQIGQNVSPGSLEETAKAVEKGRNTLLDWIKSPFYKARLEDEPLYRAADNVVTDAGKMIEDVPIDISKTKLELDPSGNVNGITRTRPAVQTQLPDGTIIADLNTGLDVNVASDLGKAADETSLHELLHYMTANSKGTPMSKAGEKIIEKGWMSPTETHFDAINIIHKNRSKGWQDYILDQNDSLLPQYDSVVKMVMEKPDEAISALIKGGKSAQDAKAAIQSLRSRYSMWYDIQEQRAYLQQLFHSKIRPNLKNPNDAAEIEEYLSSHPEVLENFPAYKYIQEVRPGSIKDYAKYFSAALGTVPFVIKTPSKNE